MYHKDYQNSSRRRGGANSWKYQQSAVIRRNPDAMAPMAPNDCEKDIISNRYTHFAGGSPDRKEIRKIV
jgi:hypothetical protein